jgi:hypothetical protein
VSTVADTASPYSAAEQGLGYIFQPRWALLKQFELPETSVIFIEADDDVTVVDEGGKKQLHSLKHKDPSDRLTDLSTDFWKSVRIWLAHYLATGRLASDAQFFMLTTASISSGSLMEYFTQEQADPAKRATEARATLDRTTSAAIVSIRGELAVLSEEEAQDFYNRITIFPDGLRITTIPEAVLNRYLRTVRREWRGALFERLEGWWINEVIDLLAGVRTEPISVAEVSERLALFAEEYRSNNLPITFRGSTPAQVDADKDSRQFVQQLREIEISTDRIRLTIIDYYRAFEQRSQWARESLLVSGEIEEYEQRLIDEWTRFKDICFERISDSTAADACVAAGRELYQWAELQTDHLRIRERVTEPYVVRGTFHILANATPLPQVHWHPWFLRNIKKALGAAA